VRAVRLAAALGAAPLLSVRGDRRGALDLEAIGAVRIAGGARAPAQERAAPRRRRSSHSSTAGSTTT